MVLATEITTVFSLLERTHQPTMLELLHSCTPFQQLVATLLSARTRDSTTIPIVQKLFLQYPSPEDLMRVKQAVLEQKLFRIGFYRVKARHLRELSSLLVHKYHGKVPETLEELITLPGVGRKTANCLLSYAFNQPAIAVDVHVHRLSNRLGWVKTNVPSETEQTLMKIIPLKSWNNVNRLFVGHGQTICAPLNPKCHVCPILSYCRYGRQRLSP